MTAPVPSDIVGPAGEALPKDTSRFKKMSTVDDELAIPAGEAGDLIERELIALGNKLDDMKGFSAPSSRVCHKAAARLAALQQRVDEQDYILATQGSIIAKLELLNKEAAEASEALASSLQRRVEELTGALRLPDADRRLWFISDKIGKDGFFNRFDICAEFSVSVPQASIDIRRWMAAHPGAIEYNKSAKRYEHKLRAALTPPEQGGKP